MSFLSDYLPLRPPVLDASSIINLLGCGEMRGVIVALGIHCVVEEKTLGEVRKHPIQGMDHRAELEGLRSAGLLLTERMGDEEYELYLSLVSRPLSERLDEGESAAIALAHRGYPVILDENKARGIVAREFTSLHQASTLRLTLTAGHRAGWGVDRVRSLVLAARTHARMGVPRDERGELEKLMKGFNGWPPF